MKVYFHIGTEKTGSSHLQSTAAINRQLLKEKGIWFPSAGKREGHMLGGEVSAGNAQNITNLLNKNEINACSNILADHVIKAKEHQCHSLFLSNELLVLALAEKKKLAQLEGILDQIGCPEREYLLILRDPIGKALSLLKHRAKNNQIADIELWLQENYLYGSKLPSFFEEARRTGIQLMCRKFSKKNGALNQILFNDWLGIGVELEQPPQLVNPSLSLSELSLLKKVRDRHPNIASVLYEKLLFIPKRLKAEDSGIEEYYEAILSNYMVQYNETWKTCNSQLPDNEQLVYPSKVDLEISKESIVSSFSDEQMDEISNIIVDSLSFRFKFKVESLKWKRHIRYLIKKFLKKA